MLHYTGSTLDRADHLRRDEQQIAALWEQPATLVVPVHRQMNLIDTSNDHAVLLAKAEITALVADIEPVFLGLQDDVAVFAVICDDVCAERWLNLADGYQFVDLRTIGPRLPRQQAPLLAYARGLSHWQSQCRHCAVCGSRLQLVNAGHMAVCQNADCGRPWFPRTDPAVIMLVERITAAGERFCLLGRSPGWPDRVYSTLAGFVETGESLEEAVAREVFEEAGVVVDNVRYVASQPWPFPQSIMLGFIATAKTEEITIDPEELAEAHWFAASALDSFGQWGDDSDGPKMPRPDSIARFLIDQWRESVI